jgi:peptidase M23-like protein
MSRPILLGLLALACVLPSRARGQSVSCEYTTPVAGRYRVTQWNNGSGGCGGDWCPSHNEQGYCAAQTYFAIDVGTPRGTTVYADQAGTVRTYWENLGGNVLAIDHPDGTTTYYGHLSAYYRTSGPVAKNDPVALSGDTGSAQGHPHLHWANGDSRACDASRANDMRVIFGVPYWCPYNWNTGQYDCFIDGVCSPGEQRIYCASWNNGCGAYFNYCCGSCGYRLQTCGGNAQWGPVSGCYYGC